MKIYRYEEISATESSQSIDAGPAAYTPPALDAAQNLRHRARYCAWEPPGGLLALLTPLVFLVHGYHPYADDGAIYVAGIEKLIDPALFPSGAIFVEAHTHISVFPHLLAAAAIGLHGSLPTLLLGSQLLSIFLFLLGCWEVARELFPLRSSRWAAVLLAACCFTLPVAGTALFIMDPYVTARSFSTPFCLFALAAGVGARWKQAVLWVVLAAFIHPLMAAFAGLFLMFLGLAQKEMWRSMAAFCALCIAGAAAIFFATRSISPQLDYSRAALSRSYFFLSSWAWYEYLGLFLPLGIFVVAAKHTRDRARSLSIACAVSGACALMIALCFVHRGGSLMLARVQVLRIFHMIYISGVLLAGGSMGRFLRIRILALIYCAVLGAMFAGQMATYPASDHLEWRGAWAGHAPRNSWQQAFLWIRANTPENAIFAIDADYIVGPGEDSQGFRAMAERSALADWYKDGGIAAVFPAAAGPWWRELQATRGLDRANDQDRLERLKPLGASWILLPASAITGLPCPYRNERVQVCRLGVM